MDIVTVNRKGQLTIPARTRKGRGLRGGTRVALVEVGTRIELVPLPENPIEALVGLGSKLPTIEQIEAEADVE